MSGSAVVVAYLRRHAGMADGVRALAEALRAAFALPVRLSLEVVDDPEIDYPHLVLYVRQPVYAPDILHQMQSIYLQVAGGIADTSGWLIATTDYRTV